MSQAAEQRGDRAPRRPAEQIPAGDVDGALRVPVTPQGGVHPVVDEAQVAGVEAHHGGSHLAQRGARALGERGQVGGSQGADFPPAGQAVIGGEAHHGARKPRDHPPPGHDVAAVHVVQVVAEDLDPRDLHVAGAPGPAARGGRVASTAVTAGPAAPRDISG